MTNVRLKQFIVASVGAISVCLASLGFTLMFLDVVRATWAGVTEGENPDWSDFRKIAVDIVAAAGFSLLAGAAFDRCLRLKRSGT